MNPLRAVVAAALIAAVAPSTAFASTWTVDDDKADCPNARFTSINSFNFFSQPALSMGNSTVWFNSEEYTIAFASSTE